MTAGNIHDDLPLPEEPPAWLDEMAAAYAPAPAPAQLPTLLSPELTVAQLAHAGVPARETGPGTASIILGDGLAALRLPPGRPDWRQQAANATGLRSLLNRVEWMERTNDALFLIFRIDEPELLAAHATVHDGQRVAELILEGELPLGEVARGNRGVVTTLSRSEALGVGAFLDCTSEVSTAPMPQACDIRTLTSSAIRIRDAFNREHPQVTVIDGVVHRAFDLLVRESQKSAEAIADELAEGGLAATPAEHLRATRIEQVTITRPVDEVVEEIVQVVANAVQEADATLPLVLAEPGTQGSPARLLSVTPAGEILRWESDAEMHTLVLLAIQPMRATADGPKVAHGIPSTLLGLVRLRLLAAAPKVEYILHEPAIVGERVVSHPGFDPQARALLTMPHRDRRTWAAGHIVPERPTEDDAQVAFDLLNAELLGDFPFAQDRDRARAMALLLTAVCRSAVAASPGFLADANEPGTGKSELMATVRLLGQGTKAAVAWNLGRGADEEARKNLAGALLARNTRFWHNDEVRGPIDSAFVGEIITAADGSRTIRELGGNRLVAVRGMLVTACGNNTRVADDHARRWMTIRLEKPLLQLASGRTYRHSDLGAFVRENRPALVAAAHTLVLRAIQQGPAFPVPGLDLDSSWPQRILGALTWARMTVVKADGTTAEENTATVALRGWDADVAGRDHNTESWAEALEFAWLHLRGAAIPAGEFGKTVLAAEQELPIPEELAAAFGRQIGKRWSHALKGLRNRKIILGERAFVVCAAQENGRWTFGVNAHDLRDLQQGRTEPLTPAALPEDARRLVEARKKGMAF